MSESEAAWEEIFADPAARGLRAPALQIADGAYGLWAAAHKALVGIMHVQREPEARRKLEVACEIVRAHVSQGCGLPA